MPLYDYRCDTCGDFEAWRRLVDLELAMICPTCSSHVQRLFLPANINLSSCSFSKVSRTLGEPRMVTRKVEGPSKPRAQATSCSRPWMIGHTPERL